MFRYACGFLALFFGLVVIAKVASPEGATVTNVTTITIKGGNAVVSPLVETAAAVTPTASFQGLGFLPPYSVSSVAMAVSSDGSVIAGYSSRLDLDYTDAEAVRWVNGAAPTGLGFLGGTWSQPSAISSDGSVVAGISTTNSFIHSERPFRWTNGVMTPLDLLPNHSCGGAFGVSGDGNVVVGTEWTCLIGGNYQGFRWDNGPNNGTMTPLNSFTGDSRSNAVAVSADGLVIVGQVLHSTGNWEPVRWVNGVTPTALGVLSGYVSAFASGISATGSVVVGVAQDSSNNMQAFRCQLPAIPSASPCSAPVDGQGNGNMGLGFLPGSSQQSNAMATSSDGNTVVGTSGNAAFRWTPSKGMESIQTLLVNSGVDLTGWALTAANGISADGTVIAGYGVNPDGKHQGWIAKLPMISHGVDYRARGRTSTANVDLAAISKYNGFGAYSYTGGSVFVGAYLGCQPGHLRRIPDTALFGSNNLAIVSLFEKEPRSVLYFTLQQADIDVKDAIAAAHAAGQPPESAIYFTVDFDPAEDVIATQKTELAAIDAYFQVIRNGLIGSGYKLGVYAAGIVLSTLAEDLNVKPDYTWLPTASFKRSGFTGENIDQVYADPPLQAIFIGTLQVDLDTALTPNFGQWSGESALDYAVDPKCR